MKHCYTWELPYRSFMTNYLGDKDSKAYLTMTSTGKGACDSWKGHSPGEGSNPGAVIMEVTLIRMGTLHLVQVLQSILK